ncbi:hypothetical protein [Actinoplanes sp. NBRC 101535]|uniref:hypothetical protein n=1 Tax=Actinoplanes sp. NBRC 101535 TaxID=3032196 RepID=UPI0025540D48|nr:hypothetical protein [Actinoplanes sp. NBRC 101535]
MEPLMRGLCAAAATAAVVIVGTAGPAAAVPETPRLPAAIPNLDSTFGSGGYTTLEGSPEDTEVDSTGRALILTTTKDGKASLTRLTANGAKDTTFGVNGTVSLPFAGDISLGVDGTISIVGSGDDDKGVNLLKLSSTGQTLLQTLLAKDAAVDKILDVAARKSGGLLVHGIDEDTTPATHTITAVTPSGTLDNTWGQSGLLNLKDQNLVSVGVNGDNVLTVGLNGIKKYGITGLLDKLLGTLNLPLKFKPDSVESTGNGFLVNGLLTGLTQRMAVLKLLPSGLPDTSFGLAGLAVGDAHKCSPTSEKSFTTSVGVYVIGSNADCGDDSNVYVHRFTLKGLDDKLFGDNGEVEVDDDQDEPALGDSDGGAQPDGKVLVSFASGTGDTTSITRLLSKAAGVLPFVSLTASKVLDRVDTLAKKTATVPVLGKGGIPSTGVAAVTLDVTADKTKGDGGVIAYPSGGSVPNLVTNLHNTGQSVTQRLTVPVGNDGKVLLQNASTGAAQLTANVVGYYPTGGFVPVTPTRLLNGQNLGGGSSTPVVVGGKNGIPSTGVDAVVVNVGVDDVAKAGGLKVFPTGSAVPSTLLASHSANQPGSATLNVSLGTGGKLNVLNTATSTADVTLDVVGYIPSSSGS